MNPTLQDIKNSAQFYAKCQGINVDNFAQLKQAFPLYNLNCRHAWEHLLEDLKAQVDSSKVANLYCSYKGFSLHATSNNPYFSELHKLINNEWVRVGTLRYNTLTRLWAIEDEEGLVCQHQSLKALLTTIQMRWTRGI